MDNQILWFACSLKGGLLFDLEYAIMKHKSRSADRIHVFLGKEHNMDIIKKLFKLKHPYDYEKSERLFSKAIRQNCIFHYEHNADYQKLLDRFGFSPYAEDAFDDLAKLPPIPTLYFKHHRLISVSDRKLVIKATSSGTSGQNRSMVGLDLYSMWRGFDEVKRLFAFHKIWSLKPTRFVIFGYEHKFKNKKAVAQTAWGFTFTAPAVSKDYVLRYQNGNYVADLDNIEKKLIRYAKGKLPVRTIGFPAYTYFLLNQMKEHGVNVKLPKGSILTLGGGWKQFYAEQITKEAFYALAYEVLGIEKENITEFFGAVEHPVMWTQCKNHHFHVPNYARVIIRDVDDLHPLANGEVGIINLLTPMCRATPLTSIMTDDLGILHDNDCDCGIDSPYLEIIGRVGIEDIKTCAAGAEDLLKGGKA